MSTSSVVSSRPQSVQSKLSPVVQAIRGKIDVPGIGVASQVLIDITSYAKCVFRIVIH